MESLFDISTAFGSVETSLANKKHNKPSNRNLTFITLFYYNGNMWGTGQTSIYQPQPAKGRPLHGRSTVVPEVPGSRPALVLGSCPERCGLAVNTNKRRVSMGT